LKRPREPADADISSPSPRLRCSTSQFDKRPSLGDWGSGVQISPLRPIFPGVPLRRRAKRFRHFTVLSSMFYIPCLISFLRRRRPASVCWGSPICITPRAWNAKETQHLSSGMPSRRPDAERCPSQSTCRRGRYWCLASLDRHPLYILRMRLYGHRVRGWYDGIHTGWSAVHA
jgi:hypothetical protein